MNRGNIFLSISLFAIFVVSLLAINQFQQLEPFVKVTVKSIEGDVWENRAGDVMKISEEPRRGSVVSTEKDSYLILQVGKVLIGLDEHTSVRLDRLSNDRVEIFVPTGRIIVDALEAGDQKVSVHTGATEITIIRAMTSVVNFAADARVHVIPMESVAGVIINRTDGQIIKTPLEIQEVAPFTTTDIEFDPEKSSAREFYSWFTDQKPGEALE